MAEDTYSFEQARVRLEEIAAQVRKKDVSLERSLDLLEEGVRLANLCTEQIDQTQWKTVLAEAEAERAEADRAGQDEPAPPEGEAPHHEEGTDESPEDGGAGAIPADDDVASEDDHGVSEPAEASEEPDVEA